MQCGVVWCGVVLCGVILCGVVWYPVVWCGVVWYGMVCQRRCYQMAMAGMVLHTGNASREGCVSKRTLCAVCGAPVAKGHHFLRRWAAAAGGCPGDALPHCLMVLLKFSLSPGLCASGPWSGIDEASTWATA